jgi:predicted Fe-Mo cluster-binding NifX family protein
MRVAIPVWNGRVSPVFDVAKEIRVAQIDLQRGEVLGYTTHALNSTRRASILADHGVSVLVCSAVSPPLEATLWVLGVEVISDVCGSPDEIFEALAAGDRELDRFRTPGCRRQPTRKPEKLSTSVRRRPESPG